MIASASLTNEYFHIGPQSRLLLCLSPTYIAGKMMIVRTILSGADLITIKPTSSPLQNIENDIDFAAMVPMQVETTLTNPETRSRFARIEASDHWRGSCFPHVRTRSSRTADKLLRHLWHD